jgi:hypothetical protein
MKNPKKDKKTTSQKIHAIIDPSVGNYEKHPFFVKKANEMKELIKVGLPKEFYEKK